MTPTRDDTGAGGDAETDGPPTGEAAHAEDGDADDSADAESERTLWPPSATETDRTVLASLVPSLARDPITLPGLVAVVLGLGLVGTDVAVAGAVAAVALWLLAAPTYAAAAGAVVVAVITRQHPGGTPAVVDTTGTGLGVAIAAAGIGWLLFAPVLRDRDWAPTLTATLVCAGIAVAGAEFGVRLGGARAAAALLVGVVGLGLYAVHRYSLVRLAYRDSQ